MNMRSSLTLLSFFISLRCAAESVPIVSTITAVTVYATSAIVTRTGTKEVKSGETELVFERLPASLVDGSIQVSGIGSEDITILDVTTRTDFVPAAADPRENAIDGEIAGLNNQMRLLTDRKNVLEQQSALIAKIENAVTAPAGKDTNPPRSTFDDWQKLLAFSDENRGKLSAEQRSLDADREDLKLKITAANSRLNTLRKPETSGNSYKSIVVHVSAATAGSVSLNVAYSVPQASWTPSYDARLRGSESSVMLSYFGIIRQRTGEDWNNVALTLSTARPSIGGNARELRPWFLDVYASQPMPEGRSRGLDKDDVVELSPFEVQSVSIGFSKGAGRSKANAAILDAAAIEIVSSITSTSFKIASAATIFSDNSPKKVGITTAKLDSKLLYNSAPRELEAAFLTAQATNMTDSPFLGGPVNAFLNDAFVATGSIKTVMPGEKFDLAFGADEAISVKRRIISHFSEDTGFTGKGRRILYETSVAITNNKKTAERVVMRDIVPISRNEKIVVKLITPSERDFGTPEKPKEVVRETEGKIAWSVELRPGEKREIPLKFSVDYPGDLAVTGLE